MHTTGGTERINMVGVGRGSMRRSYSTSNQSLSKYFNERGNSFRFSNFMQNLVSLRQNAPRPLRDRHRGKGRDEMVLTAIQRLTGGEQRKQT
jgi:hypothetical protein